MSLEDLPPLDTTGHPDDTRIRRGRKARFDVLDVINTVGGDPLIMPDSLPTTEGGEIVTNVPYRINKDHAEEGYNYQISTEQFDKKEIRDMYELLGQSKSRLEREKLPFQERLIKTLESIEFYMIKQYLHETEEKSVKGKIFYHELTIPVGGPIVRIDFTDSTKSFNVDGGAINIPFARLSYIKIDPVDSSGGIKYSLNEDVGSPIVEKDLYAGYDADIFTFDRPKIKSISIANNDVSVATIFITGIY